MSSQDQPIIVTQPITKIYAIFGKGVLRNVVWADFSIESWFNIQISASPPANAGFVRFRPKASKSGIYFQNVIDLKHMLVQKNLVVAEESKYQNRPIEAFQKSLSYAIFCIF